MVTPPLRGPLPATRAPGASCHRRRCAAWRASSEWRRSAPPSSPSPRGRHRTGSRSASRTERSRDTERDCSVVGYSPVRVDLFVTLALVLDQVCLHMILSSSLDVPRLLRCSADGCELLGLFRVPDIGGRTCTGTDSSSSVGVGLGRTGFYVDRPRDAPRDYWMLFPSLLGRPWARSAPGQRTRTNCPSALATCAVVSVQRAEQLVSSMKSCARVVLNSGLKSQ
jgi:hypothetical protein